MSEEEKKESGAVAAAPAPAEAAGSVAVQNVNLNPISGSEASATPSGLGLEHLFDISLEVSVDLGKTQLPIDTLTKLGPGSVITLDREVTEPVEVFVNGKLVARGEVVTIGDRYGIRVTSIEDPGERLKALG